MGGGSERVRTVLNRDTKIERVTDGAIGSGEGREVARYGKVPFQARIPGELLHYGTLLSLCIMYIPQGALPAPYV